MIGRRVRASRVALLRQVMAELGAEDALEQRFFEPPRGGLYLRGVQDALSPTHKNPDSPGATPFNPTIPPYDQPSAIRHTCDPDPQSLNPHSSIPQAHLTPRSGGKMRSVFPARFDRPHNPR